ncbi:hypothetical protein BDR03DRAFT_934343 [Suillus americanus]|nr:hypothetical protein BDR03DRAFT_934343 [Suillus americanus]
MEDSNRTAQYHPQSGYVYGDGQNIFQQIRNDEHEPKQTHNLYWPKWSHGKFLVETMMQTEINCFLKLARELLSWMDLLPPGPKWCIMQFEVQGYTTAAPIHLIWRDGLEVAKSLFGNPIFAQNMSFDPLHVQEGVQREYGEWFTANRAFSTQDQLPKGATIMPIIAASDKTPVTRQMGGLEMHPLFLTISNIDSDIRMKATSHAWQYVAYIPIPKFETRSDYHTILKLHVWHKCVDLVFASLKVTAKVGEFMPDPFGELQYCFTPLVTWIADLPEQLMQVQKKAKELLLLGMHLPFWHDWALTQVFIFLVPEILHTLHKFFFNHLWQWYKEVVRSDELDACYKSHHKCIGVHHFSSGISHHCDIQHTIIAMISGAAPPEFVQAIRALIDFMYQVQNPVHTESSIEAMQVSLNEFHNCKVAILKAEARQGKSSIKEDFYIPKLELLLSFAEAISNNSGLIQFTADKDFGKQIFCILDHEEWMQQFNLYLLLCQHNHALVNAIVDEDEEVYSTDLTMAWVSRVAPNKQHHFSAPRPIWNHFTKGILSDSNNAALTITCSPDGSNLSWPDVMHTYGLPDLCHKVTEYIQSQNTFSDMQMMSKGIWSKVCIQLHSTFCPSIIMPSQAVQAQPPSDTFPYRNCDAMFLDMDQGTNNPGFPIAQVRILPDFLLHPLLYVQPFHIIKTPKDLEDTWLWKLERVYAPAMQPKTRTGFVIPIMEVTHAAELVPVYGEKVDRSLTSATSQEHYDHFILTIMQTRRCAMILVLD